LGLKIGRKFYQKEGRNHPRRRVSWKLLAKKEGFFKEAKPFLKEEGPPNNGKGRARETLIWLKK